MSIVGEFRIGKMGTFDWMNMLRCRATKISSVTQVETCLLSDVWSLVDPNGIGPRYYNSSELSF